MFGVVGDGNETTGILAIRARRDVGARLASNIEAAFPYSAKGTKCRCVDDADLAFSCCNSREIQNFQFPPTCNRIVRSVEHQLEILLEDI